jgi:ABC-type nitrate/sulfonate/bicarbonate transport system substrate-binding protein
MEEWKWRKNGIMEEGNGGRMECWKNGFLRPNIPSFQHSFSRQLHRGLAMKNRFDEMKRKILTVIAVVVAGIWFLAIPSAREVCAEPLRLGIAPTPHPALIYLADSQGFFKKHGVDVAMKEYRAGPLAFNDLTADKVDMVTTAEFVFVLQAFKHPDLRIPASICMSSDEQLVVRNDRGIARPQDLRGKRIAVTRGSSTEFFLYNYLIFNGIPAGSVQVVDIMPSQMVKAIVDGTVDAALCWPPYTSEMAKGLGANSTRWPAQSGQDYYFALFAKEGFLKKRSKTMEQFLAALSDAEGFISKYPDRAQDLIRRRLGLDTASFLATWSRSRFQLQLTQDMLVLMEREAKWAIRSNLVGKKQMPNYLDFFYFDALDKVKPEAVSIVH